MDQIVAELRKADVELGKGKKMPEVCKLLEIAEQAYCIATSHNILEFCGRVPARRPELVPGSPS